MNNLAIVPNIALYALQNQNVERKFAKQIDINHLNQQAFSNINISDNDEFANENSFEVEIPAILIPKDEPEPLPNIGETFINNENLVTITDQ